VIALILVFVAALLKTLQLFYEDSEQMQFEATLERLDRSINSLVAEHVAKGDLQGLAAYRHTNPMQLLGSENHNYLGEFSQGAQTIAPASWYFNRTYRQLSYQLRDASSAKQGGGQTGEISFKLRLKYQDNNHNERYDRGVDHVSGLALEPVYPYQWLAP